MTKQRRCFGIFRMDFGLDGFALKKNLQILAFEGETGRRYNLQEGLFVVAVFSHFCPLPFTVSSFLCGKWADVEKRGWIILINESGLFILHPFSKETQGLCYQPQVL